MAASIENAGPIIDTQDTALAELNQDFLDEFGTGVEGIDTSANSYTGRQNPILTERYVLLQQLLVELTSLFSLNNAQGRFLDFIGTLLDEQRLEATSASIRAICYGTPGFNCGDRRVRYLRNGTIWRVPIGTLVGANGQVTVNLTADDLGTTTGDGTLIEAFQDGSDQWVIVDTNSNFTFVESVADYSVGRDVEGPTSYRARLRVAGRGSGTSTEPGVLRSLQRVAGSSARIDNNRTLFPNANGVPPKSIEALVDGGTDAEVAQILLDSYSITDGFFGTTTATAYDANGVAVDVDFTRIERVEIEWAITIDTTGAEADLPDNPTSVVQSAVADYTNELNFGIDAQPEEAAAAIRNVLAKGAIPDGNLKVQVALKGGSLGTTPIPITSRQRARTDAEPQSATITGTNTQTFNIIAGQTLVLAADGGTAQAVTFVVTDFQIISQATTLELATAINARTTGLVAGTEQGALTIRSETTGAASSVNVTVSSDAALLATLGLSYGLVNGSDGDISVTLI